MIGPNIGENELEKLSKKYSEENPEYAAHFELLDELQSNDELGEYFDAGVFTNDKLNSIDRSKAVEALEFLKDKQEIKMGIILKDESGNFLTKTFNEGFPFEWPETVFDNEGNAIPESWVAKRSQRRARLS